MTAQILIGIGGLLLSVLTYFAGVYRTERRHKKDDREARIIRVLDKYMDFRRSNYTSGLVGLQKAGIATLVNDDEIVQLKTMIVQHGEKNPFGRDEDVLLRVGLKKFFDYTANNNTNFFQTSVEEITRKIETS